MAKIKTRRPFRMKQFQISDRNSGCKIGVDGVLIGSWAPIPLNAKEILDVGCGCGIISMMLAQRVPNAHICGIDIINEAVAEALENIRASVFNERIDIFPESYTSMADDIKSGKRPCVDLIVSNPPFFDSGVAPDSSERMTARHVGTLSPEILMRQASDCLASQGILAFIAPCEYTDRYLEISRECGLQLIKSCAVQGHPGVPPKRIMLAFTSSNNENNISPDREILIIRDSNGDYTQEYIELGKPFYLKF